MVDSHGRTAVGRVLRVTDPAAPCVGLLESDVCNSGGWIGTLVYSFEVLELASVHVGDWVRFRPGWRADGPWASDVIGSQKLVTEATGLAQVRDAGMGPATNCLREFSAVAAKPLRMSRHFRGSVAGKCRCMLTSSRCVSTWDLPSAPNPPRDVLTDLGDATASPLGGGPLEGLEGARQVNVPQIEPAFSAEKNVVQDPRSHLASGKSLRTESHNHSDVGPCNVGETSALKSGAGRKAGLLLQYATQRWQETELLSAQQDYVECLESRLAAALDAQNQRELRAVLRDIFGALAAPRVLALEHGLFQGLDEAAKERLRRSLQGKLRKLAVRCLGHLDLSDPRSRPALLRVQHLICRFELQSSLDVSRARGGGQWQQIKMLLSNQGVPEIREVQQTGRMARPPDCMASQSEVGRSLSGIFMSEAGRCTQICTHGKMTTRCAQCTGCRHGKLQQNCQQCKPCPHGKVKWACPVCSECRHGKHKRLCVSCSGCPHGRMRAYCAECKSCPHGKAKKLCVKCSGCPHQRFKSDCADCTKCPHGTARRRCGVCRACPHGRLKKYCPVCKGCPHGKLKQSCVKCNGCPHGKLRVSCTACTGCPHGRLKRNCSQCIGCEHGKVPQKCKLCKAQKQ